MICYLLDEPFSAYTGLALSSIVANMMRLDANSIVVCPEADDTWGFSANRTRVIPKLGLIVKIKGSRFIPLWVRRRILSWICSPLLSQLQQGDIVWCQNRPYIAEALEQAIRRRGARLIYHCQNSHVLYAKRTKFKYLTPDALIFNSEAMRQEVLCLLPRLKNTFVIHNGARANPGRKVDAEPDQGQSIATVLYVGRLVPAKGVHVLIEAMKILNERSVRAICKIVGSSHAGGNKNRMTSYIRSLHRNSPPNVQFKGFRAATVIGEEYRAADILCCPSVWREPFGNVNIEAMATGIPVVASRVGGIPEIAAEGGILLVEPNSPGELADALQKLIMDKDLRAKMGADGFASFQRRFTWEEIFRQHREVIKRLR